MEEDIVEFNGQKIDLSKLSDEELIELYKDINAEELKIKKLMNEYLGKYPFLKNIK